LSFLDIYIIDYCTIRWDFLRRLFFHHVLSQICNIKDHTNNKYHIHFLIQRELPLSISTLKYPLHPHMNVIWQITKITSIFWNYENVFL